ncbi:ABC transporter ATP-binding protein [Bosea sp. (in: a-proteobacteria)]|jgi:ABC-type polysaccharide/polyol phosphate transport system ATPase subunit|uniref:ABC transporter ATP-binding protein n=1 Tax=Bosea sp. (in: a-proteobacteria) TaxID=1871050 RepID=UPI002DDCF9C8|nr:ABC transporter ATP-binding protein [Bosea sp. (in: a-proteobacteria)]HEV2508986.1 ABC transporter ATP-binding protein [Bosea sp. (in: a-proteobacteria)]
MMAPAAQSAVPEAELAIRLQGVSKIYRLFASPGDRLREALSPFRKSYHREFWALRDVDLDVPRGKTIGIVGVNGSGKSTLLQIICSVLQPTQGTVDVRGRVAALLELGAGFNPDLTGRENVITNAMIMGLDERSIEARIEEVQAFADVGDFFDQPVKIYSSGMFMRVAFAAAVHVDPDILIVDEALAVGDAKFQEKCFRKFRSFQEAGKTILYVTHDRASVTAFCDEAILLHQGRVVDAGEPRRIVARFTEIMTTGSLQINPASDSTSALPSGDGLSQPLEALPHKEASESDPKNGRGAAEVSRFLAEKTADGEDRCILNPLYNKSEVRYGNKDACIVDFLIFSDERANSPLIDNGAIVEVYLKVQFNRMVEKPIVGLTVSTGKGVTVYADHTGWMDLALPPGLPGTQRAYRFRFPMAVAAGACFIDLGIASSEEVMADVRSRIVHFDVRRIRIMDGLINLDAAFEAFDVE